MEVKEVPGLAQHSTDTIKDPGSLQLSALPRSVIGPCSQACCLMVNKIATASHAHGMAIPGEKREMALSLVPFCK